VFEGYARLICYVYEANPAVEGKGAGRYNQ
jgi:hypothetical protein